MIHNEASVLVVEDFLQKEQEKLKSAWMAFLRPLSRFVVPVPPIYQEEFERASKIPPQEKSAAIMDLLPRTRKVLSWLLETSAVREQLPAERLYEIEKTLKRLKALEEQVSFLNQELLKDELTDLWNKRALKIFFPEVQKRIIEQGTLYVLVYLDICGLKRINDAYGHHVGDKLIKASAKRLKLFTKGMDIVIRLYGDEFVILLAIQSLEGISHFLHSLVSEPIIIQVNGDAIKSYFSCGFTDILVKDTLEGVLRRADKAMYKHKEKVKEWLKNPQGKFPKPILERAKIAE